MLVLWAPVAPPLSVTVSVTVPSENFAPALQNKMRRRFTEGNEDNDGGALG